MKLIMENWRAFINERTDDEAIAHELALQKAIAIDRVRNPQSDEGDSSDYAWDLKMSDSDRMASEIESANLDAAIADICRYDWAIMAALSSPTLTAASLKVSLNMAGAGDPEVVLNIINFIEDKTGMSLDDISKSAFGKKAREFAKAYVRSACKIYKDKAAPKPKFKFGMPKINMPKIDWHKVKRAGERADRKKLRL